MTKKVLLFEHIPTRDGFVDAAMEKHLESLGHVVWRKNLLDNPTNAILTIKPDIVILPEIRLECTRDMARNLKSWGVKVVQRRCEMGITEPDTLDEELQSCLFGNVDYFDCIDLDLCWGEKFREALIQHGSDPEKVKAVGALGLDPYFNFAGERTKRDKPCVMFATGFGYADRNPMYAIPESKDGQSINWRLVKEDRENREEFVRLIEEFIKHGDGWDIIVRPHPGESFEYYHDIFGDRIINTMMKPTPMALLDVDLLVHAGSTMSIEAHLFNIPAFNYRNTCLDPLIGDVSPLYDVKETLVEDILNTELGKSNASGLAVDYIKPYFGTMDGKACARAVAEIDKLEVQKTTYPEKWPEFKWQYATKNVYPDLDMWNCPFCFNRFFGTEMHRTEVKCPYCGIMCIKRG